MFKITLSDGTVIDNIGVNESTLISYEPLDTSIFENNTSPVEIEWVGDISEIDGGAFIYFMNGTHSDMTFYYIGEIVEGEYWFTLTDVPESEIRYARLQSNIDYIAMMTDIEL